MHMRTAGVWESVVFFRSALNSYILTALVMAYKWNKKVRIDYIKPTETQVLDEEELNSLREILAVLNLLRDVQKNKRRNIIKGRAVIVFFILFVTSSMILPKSKLQGENRNPISTLLEQREVWK